MRIMLVSVLFALFFSSPIMADDKLDRLFDRLDKNHDNVISKKEFVDGPVKIDKQKAVRLFPGLGDVGHMNEKALKEKLFDRMDKNRDGLLDRSEWHQAPVILEVNF